jgi:hypothetical protein
MLAKGCGRPVEAAVRAALTRPWSNGQAEGQITKLQLVKRQLYGRGEINLLQVRASEPHDLALHQICVRARSGP